MEKTSAIVVLLAFLVLAGMIVSPVFAYDIYEEYDVTGGSIWSGAGSSFSVVNLTALNQSTIIGWSWTGIANTGDINKGTSYTWYDVDVKSNSETGKDNYGTLSYTCDKISSDWTAVCTWSFILNTSRQTRFQLSSADPNVERAFPYPALSGVNWATFFQPKAAGSRPGGSHPLYMFTSATGTAVGHYHTYYIPSVVTPVAGFTCTPTSQYPDSDVVCTDSSTNTPTSWLWSIDAEAMGIKAWQTHTGQNFTWQSHYPGLYTVNLKATNSAGSDWENKTNYVSISVNATPNTCDAEPASGYSRTKFRCMNPSNDASVFGCNIQLHDLEGGAWSNQSNIADAIWCIDTLPGHHINAYADATGYTSGSRLNLLEWDNMQYTLPLIPGYVPPAASGYVWVYVYITDWATSTPLSGVTVSLSGTGLSTQTATTGSSGSVALQWKNLTTAYINAAKPGYTTGSKTLTTSSFGPDITYLSIHQGIYTATLTPVGTAVTTIGPYGTPGPMGTMPPGYTNNQGQIMMDFLARNGLSLVELCFFVTVLALLGVKLGK